MLQELPSSTVSEAADLFARGFRPLEHVGQVSPPLGVQLSSAQYVSDWCWQALTMMELQSRGVAGDVFAGPRPTIAPTFGPGSGWHQAGQWSPSSQTERSAMREAARPATVVVLRRRGARIPVAELLRMEPPSGLLLCMNRYTAPAWYACLFRDEALQEEALPRLLHAQLERENDGVRLYGGLEVDRHQEWRQAWLCTPTPGRAREILLDMLARDGGEV